MTELNLDTMSAEELETELVKYANKTYKTAWAWARAENNLDNLEGRKKDKLEETKAWLGGKTDAEMERKARLTKEWLTFKDAILLAKVAEREAKVEYDMANLFWKTIHDILYSRNNSKRIGI